MLSLFNRGGLIGLGCTLFSVVLGGPRIAQGLTIIPHFVDNGQPLPLLTQYTTQNAGTAPAGGTNQDLQNIFQAAANVWENVIHDPYTVTVSYGWYPWSGNVAASTYVQGDQKNLSRADQATIGFNNNSIFWFFDTLPTNSSAYPSPLTNDTRNLGGGIINTGRYYTGGAGAAANVDLFTVALHELGHCLGLSNNLAGFGTDYPSGYITVTAGHPDPGTVIPLSSPYADGHINLPNALMNPYVTPGIRKLPSDTDILAVAEVANYQQITFNPVIPEPATLVLIAGGLLLAPVRSNRLRQKTVFVAIK